MYAGKGGERGGRRKRGIQPSAQTQDARGGETVLTKSEKRPNTGGELDHKMRSYESLAGKSKEEERILTR